MRTDKYYIPTNNNVSFSISGYFLLVGYKKLLSASCEDTHPPLRPYPSFSWAYITVCLQEGVFFCLLSFALKLERASLFLCHRFLTFLAQVFTHKSEEGFYRFCSKRQKFCSFARPTLTINATPIPSIAMHISSLLDPFYGQFKFLSTPKYHYSQKFPALSLERVQQ